ncbi:pentapeptide repeat-containing protein [Lentzea aerocolonigenes]|uniref:pentapeptide repeat-containing protein n=1 Tax=Lentzea aerocolonigenes TaxID=68170 RepID=UPI000691ECDB|nr:pentapeptide repeat-containing protein [Lentzea aerocolonigenes]MCP2245824.1 hypothetical protein [Lentzea aerocolonigenes]
MSFPRRLVAVGLVGTVLILISLITLTSWQTWAGIGDFLWQNRIRILLIGLGSYLLFVAIRNTRRLMVRRPRSPALRPAVVVGAGVIVAAVGWGATSWLLAEANKAPADARPQARVEAIKTGLSIGAGTGGVFALLLAVRRQWHQEITAADTNLDASEKRITELYTKAVEQLGSDKAPVRLGGLYALERLAQNNESQRQTIVNVFCAYLRMPNTYESASDQAQEREVRLTAQHLIRDHLHAAQKGFPPSTFWPGIRIDLTGAVLEDFSLAGCQVGPANFTDATFTGTATFAEADLRGHALFARTRFEGFALFDDTTFPMGITDFVSATFTGPCSLDGASFGTVYFHSATFKSSVTGTIHASEVYGQPGTVYLCPQPDPFHRDPCPPPPKPPVDGVQVAPQAG